MVGWAFRYGKPSGDGPAQDHQANSYYPGNQHNFYLDRHGHKPACSAAFRQAYRNGKRRSTRASRYVFFAWRTAGSTTKPDLRSRSGRPLQETFFYKKREAASPAPKLYWSDRSELIRILVWCLSTAARRPIVSVTASLRERGRRVSLSTRMTFSTFSATDAGARSPVLFMHLPPVLS